MSFILEKALSVAGRTGLDGEFSNLMLLRSLRDNAEAFIKKKLRKLLSLECVRNKDRMAVEPIIRLTRPEVLKVLEDVKFVVHTIVPEQYRFWKSNQRGVCPHPIAVSEGPTGSILALDYNFETGLSRLLTIRLHQPADVSVVRDGLKDARNLCFINGIAFLCERGKSTISFVDFEGKVKISTKSLKRRAELLRHLEALSLPTDGTVPVLRERLKDHLGTISKNTDCAEHVQMHPNRLGKPSAVYAASNDLLFCSDDESQYVYQITLTFDGVTIHGNATKFTAYPSSIINFLSITLLDQYAFFSGASSHGGLYKCELSAKTVTKAVCNSTLPCSEVNQVCTLNGRVVYTDTKGGKVMQYNPDDKSVRTLVGSGHNSSSDGTQDSCSFKQIEGICSVDKNLFVTDVSAGKLKIVTSLSETVSFLGILGSLYDTFGIHSKGMKPDGVSLKQAKENVTKIDSYVKDTVSKVKERYQLSETSATNGPQGTVSQKTQVSVSLLKKGIERLYKNVVDINPQFVDDLLLETLLTTVVENLHAVSHLKHETFTVLTYAQDFGAICKESLKRASRWAAKYYTHDKSYYPVPQSAMPLSAIATMTPLPSEDITPGMEGQIKEWLQSYRPVRQRTVRSETTKDKAGALPPAVYAVHHTDESEERLRYPEENTVSSANAQRVVSIQFVDEGDVTEVFEDHREVQIDEYETDSDDEESDFEEHPEVVNRACVTRSGRAVRAFVRLDM